MKRLIIIFLLFTIFQARSQEELKSNIENYFLDIFDIPGHVINRPTLQAEYGLAFPSISGDFNSRISNCYSLGLYYGFTRIEDNIEPEGIFDHAQEYIFLSTITTHLKLKEVMPNGIILDSWRFGFGRRDGLGYKFGKNSRLFLSHTGSFAFSRIDFQSLADKQQEQNYIERFDEDFRFGTIYRADVDLQLFPIIHISFGYEHSIVHPDYQFWPWAGSIVYDVLTQRWVDVFEPYFLKKFGENWPWMRFVAQNIISLITYEFRRYQQSWPVPSEKPITFETFNIGFTFIF